MLRSGLPRVGILFQQAWSQTSTAPLIAKVKRYQLISHIIILQNTKEKAGYRNLKQYRINKELYLIVDVFSMNAN